MKQYWTFDDMVELAYDPREKSAMFSGLPIRVHSWGGFGSQLNALAVIQELTDRNPRRGIELVIHTGGVTKRDFETSSLLPSDIRFRIVDDFKPSSNSNLQQSTIRSLLARAFEWFRLVVKLNHNSSFECIKPWTISVRGHYSYISHSKKVLDRMIMSLGINQSQSESESKLLHYRLGDLLEIDKGFIDPKDLVRLMESLCSSCSWWVVSDSPEKARSMLINQHTELQFECINVGDPIDVIRKGVQSDFFIGTNSKLSIWIALLRTHLLKQATYLPRSLQSTIESIVTSSRINLISFYN